MESMLLKAASSARARLGNPGVRCGQQAALALSDRNGRRSVICVARDTDSYSRCHPMLHPFGQFEYHGKYEERVDHG